MTSHSAGVDTQLSLAHIVAPPSAFADVPALPAVAPTSQCTTTVAIPKQENALGRDNNNNNNTTICKAP